MKQLRKVLKERLGGEGKTQKFKSCLGIKKKDRKTENNNGEDDWKERQKNDKKQRKRDTSSCDSASLSLTNTQATARIHLAPSWLFPQRSPLPARLTCSILTFNDSVPTLAHNAGWPLILTQGKHGRHQYNPRMTCAARPFMLSQHSWQRCLFSAGIYRFVDAGRSRGRRSLSSASSDRASGWICLQMGHAP